jgi:orotidine-5'-phosphate decarboxylase
MTFMDLLQAKWDEGKFVCVGLDPDYSKIPDCVKAQVGGEHFDDHKAEVLFLFCRAIVDATHDNVLAYKPNSAFFERYGWEGVKALEDVIAHIKQTYPDIPVILDAKRGDIGNTNDGYVEAAFDKMGADAITVHGYMGEESLRPFLDRTDKGIIVLCRTSNPGAGEFQDLQLDDKDVYEAVAMNVANIWNKHGNCAVVVGATAPEELGQIRRLIGDMPILIPGVGAQGARVEDVVPQGVNSRGQGIIINLSRNVLYASGEDDFTIAARLVVEETNDAILIAGARGKVTPS